MFDAFAFLPTDILAWLLVPLILFPLLSILINVSMSTSSASPAAIARAVMCYIMQAVGVMFIASAVMPVLPELLSQAFVPSTPLSFEVFLAPLLLLVAGVWLLVHFNIAAHELERSAITLPRIVFLISFEMVGILMIIGVLVNAMLSLLIDNTLADWANMVTLLLGGILLTTSCSYGVSHSGPSGFAKMKMGRRKK